MEVGERDRLRGAELVLAVERLALVRDVTRLALVVEGSEDVAGRGRAVPAQHLGRGRGTGGHELPAALVEHRAHPAVVLAGDEGVPDAERAGLHEQARDDAAPLLDPGLEHDAAGALVGVRLEIEQLGDEQDHLEQAVDVGALLGRDLDAHVLAAVFLDHDAVLGELLLDHIRLGGGKIDLVDRDHDRHAGRLGVIDRLDGLRHHAVVGGDHQHHDVGHLGAARAHGGEGLVAGRVEEADLLAGG